MLISEIIDEIISEIGGDSSDTNLQTKVLGYIKSALRRFPQKARSRSLVSKKSVTLSAAAQTANTPSNFIQERMLWYESGGVRQEIIVKRDTKEFNLVYRSDVVGAPEYCRIYGTTIEFNRVADQEYTVYVDCFVEIDSVSVGDTWAYDSTMAEMLKDGAKFYYYNYTEEESRIKEFGSLFAESLNDLESKYERDEHPGHVTESDSD